ncbi:MAG: hypothetical protein K6A32_07855 [Bacteroidales bacterium]|nr:hypothetical protein [Bacteroidales bacterium]
MKRTLFTAILAIVAMVAFAKADEKQLQLTKTDGIANFFDKSQTATVKFVYASDCVASYMGANKIPYAEYAQRNGEWEEEHTYGESGFTEDWNKRNKKGMKIVEEGGNFQIIVTIHEIKEMAAMQSWWEIVKGDIKVLNAEGQSVVEYKINEYYEVAGGFAAMKLRNRIKETFEGLSESMLNFAKKANK